MARVSIDLPGAFNFAVELPILISHINRGDHLGNEHLIALLNEARVQFMAARGVHEFREQGYLFVNADLAVVYKSEGKYGERLKIEVAATAFHRKGCDIVYRVSDVATGREVALAKTAHLMFDPEQGRVIEAPASLRELLVD
jgi:4-hydroxybenzoyl-CoA thioesterase